MIWSILLKALMTVMLITETESNVWQLLMKAFLNSGIQKLLNKFFGDDINDFEHYTLLLDLVYQTHEAFLESIDCWIAPKLDQLILSFVCSNNYRDIYFISQCEIYIAINLLNTYSVQIS